MMSTAAEHIIRAGEAYPLPVFKRISGLRDAAMRAARRNGLPIRKVGTRSYILGDDWLRFLQRCPARVDD